MNAMRQWMNVLCEAEQNPPSDEQELAALIQRRDELVHHWNTVIKPTEPTTDTQQWWNDPEKGGLWPKQIYPLNQQIERLQAEIKTRQRTAKLQGKRGTTEGFDTSEVLYHGTNAEFDVFDRKMARTAAHIYTSPDVETAEGYGDRIYAVYGRQEPQAVLTAEHCDYQLLRKVYRKGGYKRGHGLTFKDFAELVTDAGLYNYDYKGRLQDEVIDDCLALGYRSVRITDAKPGGSFSDSVIFGSADDLQIIEEVEPDALPKGLRVRT